MKYTEFNGLVRLGELSHIDFKLECHAFEPSHPDSEADKAELAKDICAMANNGSRASFLLIGVSDDGRHLKSTSNPGLTDDNLQSFCKQAIHPPPNVKLEVCWKEQSNGSAPLQLVAIKIGPNPKHAYRLYRDFIDLKHPNPKKRYCFRRNEIWIRRGATSDIATPEEIVSLMKGRRIPAAPDNLLDAVDYSRLERDQHLPRMLGEAKNFFAELGYFIDKLDPDKPSDGFRVVIPLGSRKAVFRCVALRALAASSPTLAVVKKTWAYEHGMFLLLLGQITKQAFPYPHGKALKLQEAWGFFSRIQLSLDRFRRLGWSHRSGTRIEDIFSLNFPSTEICVLTLIKSSSSLRLRDGLAQALEFLRSDSGVRDALLETCNALDDSLRSCLQEGWIQKADHWHRDALKKGEFRDERWPHDILIRRKDAELNKAAREILKLSGGSASEVHSE